MADTDDEFLRTEHDLISIIQPAVNIRFQSLSVQESPVHALQVPNKELPTFSADHAMPSSDIQIFPDPAIDVDSPSEQEFRTFYQENIKVIMNI